MKLLRVTNFASEPTLKPGKFFLASALKKPRRFNLISYRAVLPDAGVTILTHRVCGMPGDTVEIKAGVLYVNGQEADGALALKHIYKINSADSTKIVYDHMQAYTIPPYSNTLYIALEDKYISGQQIPCERYVLPRGLRDENIFLLFKKNWNRDHFGPLRVPPGKFFALGDNRGRSRDSRYLGLIDQEKVVGTVLWK